VSAPRRSVNPTVRAFAIILAIVCLVVIFQLYTSLAVLWMLLQIAFVVVIALFLYRLWRERRSEIGMWPARARLAFYGAILIGLLNIVLYFGSHLTANHRLSVSGLVGVAWLLVFPICGYTIWRAWHDQHTYI
jgi:small-conductance mechanosensitive channel